MEVGMRAILGVLAVLVAGLVTGCSDQSSMNSLAAVESGVSTDQAMTRFDIDMTVAEPTGGDQFRVVGHVDYALVKDGSNFSLFRFTNLVVEDLFQSATCTILKSQETTGEFEPGEFVVIGESFSLDTINPKLVLKVDYRVSDIVTLGNVSVEFREVVVTDK
jgi:hypothetical protein